MIAAHPSSSRAPPDQVKTFLSSLTAHVRAFDNHEARAGPNIAFIKERFGYPEEDIKAWLGTVKFTQDTSVVREVVVRETLDVLRRAGVVSPTQSLEAKEYVDERVATILSSQDE